MKKTIRIATRKSALALWQANAVKFQLQQYYPTIDIDLIPIVTQGDKILDRSLSKIGGKGLFVKELENALLYNQADIAVHSMKDVPMQLPPGLEISAVLERGSVEDVFVSEGFQGVEDLPAGARVGTSSARRKAILRDQFPHLKIIDVRGNVQTRLAKCFSGEIDGLILAAAGLERLALRENITQRLSIDHWLPAPGQGAIGIELRSDDVETKNYIQALNHRDSWDAVMAERAVSAALNGGCGTPLAAFAFLEKETGLCLRAWVEKGEDHPVRAHVEVRGSRDDAEKLGREAASLLSERLCQHE